MLRSSRRMCSSQLDARPVAATNAATPAAAPVIVPNANPPQNPFLAISAPPAVSGWESALQFQVAYLLIGVF
jgi:hypothetical protein